jgi:hypothetical protein
MAHEEVVPLFHHTFQNDKLGDYVNEVRELDGASSIMLGIGCAALPARGTPLNPAPHPHPTRRSPSPRPWW